MRTLILALVASLALAQCVVPHDDCKSPGKSFCYQGANRTIQRLITSDPLMCSVSKGEADLRYDANCSDAGFTQFFHNDPVFRNAGLWRKPKAAVTPALDALLALDQE